MEAQRKEDIEIFEEIKKSSLFKNQHWHMMEVQEEETAELLLLWDRRLWRMCYFGDITNTLTETKQIYSLKLICNDDDGEDYSLDVFGQLCLVSTRCPRFQVIFCCPRDKCQTLTKKDPYLRLTGPDWHPTIKGDHIIEARLILKGTTESEDKYLSLSTACKLYNGEFVEPDVSRCCKKGKLCAGLTDTGKHYCLEMTRSIVTYIVVATIVVQIDGSSQLLQGRFLPGRYFFTAYASKDELLPCDDDMKVVLLDSRGDKVPVEVRNRFFVLSRRTICVNKQTESLMVSIEQDENVKLLKFTPGYEGVEKKSFDIGSCKMQVKVEWSIY